MSWTLIARALVAGAMIAAISEIGKRLPATAAIVASLPMFLAIPVLLRAGANFWVALGAGCVLTVVLYFVMMHWGPRLGLDL